MTTKPELNPPPVPRWQAGWVGYAAAGWAALYATVALVWTVTGDGFPFGEGDPEATGLLRNLPAGAGAPAFAVVLVAVAVTALVMTGSGPVARPYRIGLLGFGWLVALALLVIVPEPTVLMLAGYGPVLLVGAPFGWPDVDYAEVFTWPLLNYGWCVLGGFLLVATVLGWQRRSRAPGAPAPAWSAPAAAARWGRWAVYVAVAIPLLYAVSRYAWLLRIPFGVDGEFIDELHAEGAAWAGAWLATFAVLGAVLTLGLVQRWGERFPRWMPGVAGRRVPVMLAVVPALVVSALVVSAGIGLGTHPRMYELIADGGFWAVLPHLLWPFWGIALAAAAVAYYLRRRVTLEPTRQPTGG